MRAALNALTFDDSAEAEDITHTVVMPEKENSGKKGRIYIFVVCVIDAFER